MTAHRKMSARIGPQARATDEGEEHADPDQSTVRWSATAGILQLLSDALCGIDDLELTDPAAPGANFWYAATMVKDHQTE